MKAFHHCIESEYEEALYTQQWWSESNSVNMEGYQSAESSPSCCFSSVLLKEGFKNNYSLVCGPTFFWCVHPLSACVSALSLICSLLKTACRG